MANRVGCQLPMSVDETSFFCRAPVVKKKRRPMADITQTFRTKEAKKEQASEEMTIHDIADKYAKVFTESSRTLKVLEDFKAAVVGSTMFDEEDAKAVQKEIDALDNQEMQKYQALNNGRLELLKKYDELLGMKKNFPKMNRFFVKKQQQIIGIVQQLGNNS